MGQGKIHLFIFIAVISWGSSYIAVKAGLDGFSPYQLATYRFAVATLGFLPIILYKGLRKIPLKAIPTLAIIAIVGIVVYHLALNAATVYFSPNEVSFAANSSPVFMVFWAKLFLQESISLKSWLGVILALAGVSLLSIDDISDLRIQSLLLLAIPLSSSLFFVLQKPLLKKMQAYEVMFFAVALGAIVLLALDHTFIYEVKKASFIANFSAIYLGILPTTIAFILWADVLKSIKLSYASNFIYLVPLFTVVFSWIAFGDFPGAVKLFGGIVILLGVYITSSSNISHE